MKRLIQSLTLLAAFGAPVTHAATAVEPTFVLVHGALFTEAGWAPLKAELEAQGSRVVTLNVPGRADDGVDPTTIDIKTAAAKVCDVLSTIAGPTILVGHSQGGAVITQAFGDCGDEVKGLIFVAAVVPQNGETAFQGLNPERDTHFALCVEVDPAAGLFRLNRNGPLEASFFQDLRAVNPQLADTALASMVSEPLGIGTTKLAFDQARYDQVAKYYVEATADQVVSIETQRDFQAKVAFAKVYSLATSHTPFLSQPKATADALKDAARLVRFSGASFDEIFWNQPVLTPAAAVEVHFVDQRLFDVTLTVGEKTYTAPLQGHYTDWCNVTHFDAFDASSGLVLDVIDFSQSQCSHTNRDQSSVTKIENGVTSTYTGRGLEVHIPGF